MSSNATPVREGFITLSELRSSGERPLFVKIGATAVELTYDPSNFTPELEREMNDAQKDGRPAATLALLLMRLLRSWKVMADTTLTLKGRPGKFDKVDGVVQLGTGGKPKPESDLVIGKGEVIPLSERVLDQLLDVFTMNKIVKAVIDDQRPNDESSENSGDTF